jgi:hypothetical protein
MSSSEQHETVSKPDQDVQEAIRSDQLREEIGEPGDEGERNVLDVETAFVVFAQDGAGFGIAKLGEVSIKLGDDEVVLELAREATRDDMYRYSTEVAKDIQVASTAEATMAQFVAYTQHMQQQMQAQQIAQQTGMAPGGKGLHVPGR